MRIHGLAPSDSLYLVPQWMRQTKNAESANGNAAASLIAPCPNAVLICREPSPGSPYLIYISLLPSHAKTSHAVSALSAIVTSQECVTSIAHTFSPMVPTC